MFRAVPTLLTPLSPYSLVHIKHCGPVGTDPSIGSCCHLVRPFHKYRLLLNWGLFPRELLAAWPPSPPFTEGMSKSGSVKVDLLDGVPRLIRLLGTAFGVHALVLKEHSVLVVGKPAAFQRTKSNRAVRSHSSLKTQRYAHQRFHPGEA